MKMNLVTIAKKLNLSAATVSRALRNHPGISDATRAKVVEMANETGYKVRYSHKRRRPHAKGNSPRVTALVSGEQTNIDRVSPITHHMLKGVSDALNAFGGQLAIDFITSGQAAAEAHDQLLSRLASSDGAILIHNMRPDLVRSISATVPCVSLNYKYDIPCVDNVAPQDIDNICFLIRHLHEMGHRRIGYIDVELPHPRAKYRQMAYRLGMTAIGDEPNADLIVLCPDQHDRESMLANVLKATRGKKATAWVCGNDFVAFKLVNLLKENGIRVPDDISVTGFGGIELPESGITLCTFRIPFEEIGGEAVRLLVERMRLPSRPARQTFIDCEFAEGRTVRKVK